MIFKIETLLKKKIVFFLFIYFFFSKMILNLYFILIQSTWWDYNYIGLNEKIWNSYKKPIFVLLYSPYCPHCHGLPELIKNYSNNLGNRNDIYITMIDCTNSIGCLHFKNKGTPHLVLIIGNNVRYWPITRKKDHLSWDLFINQSIKSNLKEINDLNFNLSIQEQYGGGSIFYLETPNINN